MTILPSVLRKSAATVLTLAILFSTFQLQLVNAEDVTVTEPLVSPEVTVPPEATPESSPTQTASPSATVSPEVSPATSPTLIPTIESSPIVSPATSPSLPEEEILPSPDVTVSPEVSPDSTPSGEENPTPLVSPEAAPAVVAEPSAEPAALFAEPMQQNLVQGDEVIDENTCTFNRTVSPPSPNFFSHKGGAWTNPEVWGYEANTGIYPQVGDVVRVDHNIGLDIRGSQTRDIGGLIVGSNGRLWNSYFSQSLNVSGPVWNDGTIEKYGDIYGLGLSVGGDIVNNGIWNISGLSLIGTNARTIVPNSPMQHNTAQMSIADSLTLEGCFALSDIVTLGNKTLTIPEGSRISLGHLQGVGGHLTGGGTLRLTRGTHLDAEFTGDIRYLVFDRGGKALLYGDYGAKEIIFNRGTWEIYDNSTLTANVTVKEGVIISGTNGAPGYGNRLTIEGDLSNHGTIQEYINIADVAYFTLDVQGDVHHFGQLGKTGAGGMHTVILHGNAFADSESTLTGSKVLAQFDRTDGATGYQIRFVHGDNGGVTFLSQSNAAAFNIRSKLYVPYMWRVRPVFGDIVGNWYSLRTLNILPEDVPPSLLVEDEDDNELAHEQLLDFAGTVVGTSVGKTLRLTNFGGDILDLTDGMEVRIEGTDAEDFAVGAVNFSAIAPEGSYPVRVEFQPKTLGFKDAELIISSNDPHHPEYRIPLAGTSFSEEATIHSTKAGGVWNNPATWLEGRRPTTVDIVEILGPVTTTSEDPTVAGLLIGESGSLSGGTIGYSVFTVNGNIRNKGRVTNKIESSRSSGIGFDVYGDAINPGTMENSFIRIYGDTDREISGVFPPGVSIYGNFVLTGNPIFSGSLSYGSNAETFIDEQSSITVTASGAGSIVAPGGGTVYASGDQGIGAIVAENIVLRNGTKTINNDVHLRGDVHILPGTKVWDITKSGGARGYLYVHGNLINEGLITDNPSDYWASLRSMNLYVFGNIVNTGTLENDSTQVFWNPIEGATEYEFAITDDTNNWPASTLRATPWNVSIKDKLTSQWTWRVRGRVNDEWTEWQEYTINAPESAPSLDFSAEPAFKDKDGNPHGIDKPNSKATANEDEITFKVVYTDASEPEHVDVDLVLDQVIDFENEFYKTLFDISSVICIERPRIDSLLEKKVLGCKKTQNPEEKEGFDSFESIRFNIGENKSPQVSVDVYLDKEPESNETITLTGFNANGDAIAVAQGELASLNASGYSITTLTISSFSEGFVAFQLGSPSSGSDAFISQIMVRRESPMGIDDSAETDLQDNETTNGEQFVFQDVIPQGRYEYYFQANTGAGLVSYPEEPLIFETGYSNVVFLPGIQASRLYNQNGSKLWEPNINFLDLPQLSMQLVQAVVDGEIVEVAKSMNEEIFTKNIIDEVWHVTFNIYESFINDLKKWEQEGIYNDYTIIPYDWRLDYDDILSGGEQIGEKINYNKLGHEYIYNKIEESIASSANGKITLVAHSMGGLVAKRMFTNLNRENSVRGRNILENTENFIMVAPPQLGTPKAIASLLHAEDQEKVFGLVINDRTVRELSSIMPGAYSLLPSKIYTENVKEFVDTGNANVMDFSKLINFAGSFEKLQDDAFAQSFLEKFPEGNITSFTDLHKFLLDSTGRVPVDSPDMEHPIALHKDILDRAQKIHDDIDLWSPPTTMKVYQIAGWGMAETIRGLEYKTKQYAGQACSDRGIPFAPDEFYKCYTIDYEPLFTFDGDETVVVPSAIAMKDFPRVETFYVNMPKYNKGFTKDREHGDIMEINDIRNLINRVIQKKPLDIRDNENDTEYDNNNFPYTLKSQPVETEPYVRLALHSPVSIDIYDADGNHTGIVYDPENPDEELHIAEEIPNSYYMQFGEGKYLGIPADSVYSIQLQGLDEGTFTFEMTEVLGDEELQTNTYTDIPTNPNMKGVITLSDLDSATNLKLDNDGDGIFEEELIPDEEQTSTTLFCPDLEQPITYAPTTITPADCGDIAPEVNQLKLVDSQCNPLENVRVNLRRENGSYITYKKTDATGLVDFSDADLSSSPSIFEIDYNGAKYQTAVDTFTSGTSVQTLPYHITLKDSACEPIENARINLRRENDSYVTYTRTAPDGTATFEILPEASMKFEADLSGGKLSTEAQSAENEVILGTENFALLLTDSEANPLENVRVNLRRENDSYVTYAKTDENGVAGFEVLPGASLKHEVDYNGAKYATSASTTHERQEVDTLRFGVHLTNSNGNPLENVRVNLRRSNDSYITYSKTDAAGYGEFEVLPNAEMKLEVDYNGAKYLTEVVTVTEAIIEEMQLDATVEVSTNAIAAMVTDSNGNPIENARVNLRRENGSYVTYAKTNGSGIASFETVPGAVMKLELDYNGAKFMTEAVTVNGNTEVPITTLPYSLQLNDSNGDPLENVRVNLRRSNDSYITYTKTDVTGLATFEVVPNAEMKLEIDYNGEKFATDTVVITEETIASAQTIPYILNLHDSANNPLSNVRVNLRRGNDSYVTYTRTDEFGNASFEVVPNAEMKFEVDYNGGKYSTDSVVVTPETTPTEVVTLPLTVSLTVGDTPLSNQRVDLLRNNDSYVTYAKTDGNGAAVFEVLPQTEYKVRVKYGGEMWVTEIFNAGGSVEHGF